MCGPIPTEVGLSSCAWLYRCAERIRSATRRGMGSFVLVLILSWLASLLTQGASAQLSFQTREEERIPTGWSRGETLAVPEPVQAPGDLSMDPLGRLLLLDTSTGRIWLLPLTGEGSRATPFGASDQGAERFEIPDRVFARWGLHVYTLDPQLRAVSVFDLEGRYEDTLDLQESLTESGGPRDVEFADFVVDKDGSLIALDRLHGRLVLFDSDGLFREVLGEDLTGGERLVAPVDLEVNAGGALFAADPSTGRVVRVSRQGSIERVWNLREKYDEARPVALVFTAGVLYVADAGQNSVLALGSDGEIILRIPLDDGHRISVSTRLAAAPPGRVLVLDAGQRRVLVLSLQFETADPR